MEAYEYLLNLDFKDFFISSLGGFIFFIVLSAIVIGALTYAIWIYSRDENITVSFLMILLFGWNYYFGVIPYPYSVPLYFLISILLTFSIMKAVKER